MQRLKITGALVVATAIFTLFASYASAGERLYRWKDEAGNPVNSDRPPPQGVEYEVISTSSSMVRRVDADTSTNVDEGAVPQEVKPTASNEGEQVATQQPQVEKNPESCQRARDNLFQLDSHARIRLRTDQGEVRFLSDEEKAIEKEKALKAIEAYCD